MRKRCDLAKNRSFTGGKQSARTPSLDKNAYFQLARMIRNAGKEKTSAKTEKQSKQESS